MAREAEGGRERLAFLFYTTHSGRNRGAIFSLFDGDTTYLATSQWALHLRDSVYLFNKYLWIT